MITPLEEYVEGYASLASYNQAFNSSFNIIGYNTEKDAPNYQAGNFCIVAEDHPWILNCTTLHILRCISIIFYDIMTCATRSSQTLRTISQ